MQYTLTNVYGKNIQKYHRHDLLGGYATATIIGDSGEELLRKGDLITYRILNKVESAHRLNELLQSTQSSRVHI